MRLYANFNVAKSEIARDLKELGVKITTQTYQNLPTYENCDLDTYELRNYHYRIIDAHSIEPKDPEWARAEYNERTSENYKNPGKAWELRKDLWEKFLNSQNRFDYTYQMRMSEKIDSVIETLRKDQNSRRAILNIWEGQDVSKAMLHVRVPCSLHYQFRVEGNELNICYVMRSCDFAEHWANDLYLAYRLLNTVSADLGLLIGNVEHFVHSLHVYHKDVAEVF